MGVKHQIKSDRLQEMLNKARALNGRGVEVSPTGEHAWLAGIHEFGIDIPVTNKMRAFLHGVGVHLRKSTTVIKIPERSFLRNGFDTNTDALQALGKKLASDALTDGDVDSMLEAFGKEFAEMIRAFARGLDSPGNADLTIWGSTGESGSLPGKEADNPLVWSGEMVENIKHKKI